MTDSFRLKRQFDLIVFDWDGTLADSTRFITRAIQLAVGDIGGEVPSDERASFVIGLGLMHALAHVAPDIPQEKYPLLAERYRFHYTQKQNEICLFDGATDLLQQLKAQGYLLAVATGKSKSGLAQAIEVAQLSGFFDATRTAEETRGKPNPQMLHEIMALLGVPSQRTLMIGDTSHDLQLAANAGCASAGVAYGAHHVSLLQVHEPLFIANSMSELSHWLISTQQV